MILCIKSKASEALDGNIINFQHSLDYCKFIKTFPEPLSDVNKNYCKCLKKKIKALFSCIHRKNTKLLLDQYYSKFLPNEILMKLRELFEDNPVPIEALKCPLTLEYFDVPFAISSGWTYEKNMITELVNSNKLTDPLTRKPFYKELIYPNLSIQSAVKWYSKIRPDEVFLNDKRDIEI